MTPTRPPIRVATDPMLRLLTTERRALLIEMGQAFRLAGGSNPNRASINRKKREQQRNLRKQLDSNAHQIVTRCMDLFGALPS